MATKKNLDKAKVAKSQKEFATDKDTESKYVDLVIEHPPTKPEQTKKQKKT